MGPSKPGAIVEVEKPGASDIGQGLASAAVSDMFKYQTLAPGAIIPLDDVDKSSGAIHWLTKTLRCPNCDSNVTVAESQPDGKMRLYNFTCPTCSADVAISIAIPQVSYKFKYLVTPPPPNALFKTFKQYKTLSQLAAEIPPYEDYTQTYEFTNVGKLDELKSSTPFVKYVDVKEFMPLLPMMPPDESEALMREADRAYMTATPEELHKAIEAHPGKGTGVAFREWWLEQKLADRRAEEVRKLAEEREKEEEYERTV
jgi:hypothetical protein